uniref:Uncharacterized protein n=1 Tax=Siphoviridae sp. ctJ7x27 TaxID=2827835 RepID=A0A8S5S4P9_9CAUD|nr:MAG TPA: hypothetical protein [Siphoviridae sp. ctJ7x27]
MKAGKIGLKRFVSAKQNTGNLSDGLVTRNCRYHRPADSP